MNILFQVIYFLIPGALANMAPVFAKKIFRKFNYPLDFYHKIGRERIFGDHKTFRGLIFGVLFAVIGVYLQAYLYQFEFFKSLSIINYSQVDALLLGFLSGLGVLVGDAIGCFFKRRVGIAPGKEFMPVDQIDSPIFLILFLMPIVNFTLNFAILVVLVWFFGHLLFNYLGWYLKIKRNKF